MAEAVVRLRVDATGATRALSNVQQQTNRLSVSADRATGSLAATSTAAKGLGASLAASLAPIVAVGTAFTVLSNSVGTFLARDRDIKILSQGLQNLGASTTTLNELQEVADRFGKTTLFNEEDFTRGFNLLTSFRNIGVDAYERVAQSAADIAQVNQVDVSTSFMQLAKALQDPERNLSNLNRSGIAFTKQQTEVIKQLMKTNKVAEAHKMILDIVDESYNQLAQAAAVGFAGSVDTLGESFRDFSQALGKALVPAITPVIKGLTALLDVIAKFVNSPIGKAAILLTTMGGAAKVLSLALPFVAAGLQKVAFAGGAAAVALNALPFVAIASGIGLVTTAIIAYIDKQKEKTKKIKEGSRIEIEAGIKALKVERSKVASQKRGVAFQQERLDKLDEEIEKLERMLEIQEKTNKAKEDAEKETKKNEEAAKKLKERFMEIGKSVEEGIVQNLTDAVMGTKTLAEAAINVLNQLKRKLIEVAIERAVSGIGDFIGNALFGLIGGKMGGSKKLASSKKLGAAATKMTGIPSGVDLPKGSFNITKRARGGPVSSGGSYMVGERGPELFLPSRSGTIIPNSSLGGKSVTNNIVVNVDASGTAVQGNDAESNQFGEQLAAVIQAELINQQRTGGLLA